MTAGWGEPRSEFGDAFVDESGVEYRDESEDESIFFRLETGSEATDDGSNCG